MTGLAIAIFGAALCAALAGCGSAIGVMAAGKAAVKGGMSLTEGEVKTLLADMDGNAGLKCPHGRPAVVRLTKYEIEKMFKRIV